MVQKIQVHMEEERVRSDEWYLQNPALPFSFPGRWWQQKDHKTGTRNIWSFNSSSSFVYWSVLSHAVPICIMYPIFKDHINFCSLCSTFLPSFNLPLSFCVSLLKLGQEREQHPGYYLQLDLHFFLSMMTTNKIIHVTVVNVAIECPSFHQQNNLQGQESFKENHSKCLQVQEVRIIIAFSLNILSYIFFFQHKEG